MLRSLYSGVSGMKSNQTKMDVIGNNIANVNTTAFKAGRARFQDMISQTMAAAQGPTDNGIGGKNAQQVGLGVQVGAIDTIMTNGGLQPTNRDLDLGIEGTGFFMVKQSEGDDGYLYTRDGAFYRDYEGNLVNASGFRVQGFMATVNTPTGTELPGTTLETTDDTKITSLKIKNILTLKNAAGAEVKVNLESFSIDGNGRIVGVYSNEESYDIGQISLTKFANPEGLEKLGNNNYRATRNTGGPEVGVANEDGFGLVRPGVLEMSNVDLANEFTDLIITSRSYQANSRTITTSDEMLQELLNLKR